MAPLSVAAPSGDALPVSASAFASTIPSGFTCGASVAVALVVFPASTVRGITSVESA